MVGLITENYFFSISGAKRNIIIWKLNWRQIVGNKLSIKPYNNTIGFIFAEKTFGTSKDYAEALTHQKIWRFCIPRNERPCTR